MTSTGEERSEERALEQTAEISIDQFGDGLDDGVFPAADELTLFPANGNSAVLTITLKYSNGQPAPGKRVDCISRPLSLAGAEWRTVGGLAPRFGASAQTIRDRVTQQIVRLGVRVTPASTVTDGNGQAKFQLDSFHVCGNEGAPASDEIIATSEAGTNRSLIKCAVPDMVALTDNPAGGLTSEGLVGRHFQSGLIPTLQAIGSAWQRVGNKPAGMPNYIVVTGASLRWGGLNPPHLTHRFGGTADIRPIGTKAGPVQVGDAHYHREATGIIVDMMKRTGATEIRFADNLPGVTNVDASHKNHIHVSWLTSPSEPWFTITDSRAEEALTAFFAEPPNLS